MDQTPREQENTDLYGEQQREQIIQMGSSALQSDKGMIHCLSIIGQVEGHQILPAQTKTTKYEHVMPQLAAIEESPEIEGLLVLINTMGGDIEAGLAIAELIRGMGTPTVSLILGGGHSIGVPLAVAARRSFIAPSAAMTIHPVRLSGTIIGVSQTFTYFEKIQERIVRFVTENSRISQERFRELMLRTDELTTDMGSVISGQQAVDEGLIDAVGGLSDAMAALREMIDQNKKDRPQPQEGAPADGIPPMKS